MRLKGELHRRGALGWDHVLASTSNADGDGSHSGTDLESWEGAKQAFEGQDRSELLAMEAEGTTEAFAQREPVRLHAGR